MAHLSRQQHRSANNLLCTSSKVTPPSNSTARWASDHHHRPIDSYKVDWGRSSPTNSKGNKTLGSSPHPTMAAFAVARSEQIQHPSRPFQPNPSRTSHDKQAPSSISNQSSISTKGSLFNTPAGRHG
ncbi:hypothetical protein ACLOJK_018821 [Asimina triloba]